MHKTHWYFLSGLIALHSAASMRWFFSNTWKEVYRVFAKKNVTNFISLYFTKTPCKLGYEKRQNAARFLFFWDIQVWHACIVFLRQEANLCSNVSTALGGHVRRYESFYSGLVCFAASQFPFQSHWYRNGKSAEHRQVQYDGFVLLQFWYDPHW